MQCIKLGRFENSVEVIKCPIPTPQTGEVLLRVKLAGICGTDLELLRGYKSSQANRSLILGHEFLGEIAAHTDSSASDVPTEFRIGTRVVCEVNCSPQHTAELRAHDPGRSALGIFGRDGAFAEFICVPVMNLHKVPDRIPDEAAVFAEPLAAACRVLEQVDISPSEKVGVLGSGRLGFLVAMALSAENLDVKLLTRSRNAKIEQLAKTTKVPLAVAADISDIFDVVVDCTGSPYGLSEALRLVRPRGTIVLKSTYAKDSYREIPNLTDSVVNEINIIGSRCGPFSHALRLLESGKVNPVALIDGTFALHDAPVAFETAAKRGTMKILLRP